MTGPCSEGNSDSGSKSRCRRICRCSYGNVKDTGSGCPAQKAGTRTQHWQLRCSCFIASTAQIRRGQARAPMTAEDPCRTRKSGRNAAESSCPNPGDLKSGRLPTDKLRADSIVSDPGHPEHPRHPPIYLSISHSLPLSYTPTLPTSPSTINPEP